MHMVDSSSSCSGEIVVKPTSIASVTSSSSDLVPALSAKSKTPNSHPFGIRVDKKCWRGDVFMIICLECTRYESLCDLDCRSQKFWEIGISPRLWISNSFQRHSRYFFHDQNGVRILNTFQTYRIEIMLDRESLLKNRYSWFELVQDLGKVGYTESETPESWQLFILNPICIHILYILEFRFIIENCILYPWPFKKRNFVRKTIRPLNLLILFETRKL